MISAYNVISKRVIEPSWRILIQSVTMGDSWRLSSSRRKIEKDYRNTRVVFPSPGFLNLHFHRNKNRAKSKISSRNWVGVRFAHCPDTFGRYTPKNHRFPVHSRTRLKCSQKVHAQDQGQDDRNRVQYLASRYFIDLGYDQNKSQGPYHGAK